MEVKEYINDLVSKNKLNEVYESEFNDELNLSKLSSSMEESKAYANFWNSVISEFKEDISRVGFNYQENSKELPLSLGKRLVKKLGGKVKPVIQEGEIKYQEFNPKIVLGVNNAGLVNVVAHKSQWEKLNQLSRNTKDFSAPYVMTIGDLCYRVNIPLEVITSVGFSSPNFLNKDYQKQEVKE